MTYDNPDRLSIMVKHERAERGRRLSGDLRHLAPIPLALNSLVQFTVQHYKPAAIVLFGADFQTYPPRVQVNLIPL
jgi:hypothetical protein